MQRSFWGFVIVLVLATCGLAFRPSHASAAAEGFNVITSPLPIKISTTPGQTVTEELRLKNQGDQPEGIKVGLLKFAASGDTGQPDLYNLTPSDSYASWVHFSPAQFTAQPNVWMSVTMTINVPQNAGLGYYLAVTFSPASTPGAVDATNLQGSVATLVLLNVKTANEKLSLNLVDFSTDHGLYEYLPVNFKVTLHNSGNIYLAPAGDIFIQRGGKTVSTIDFNDAGGSVLPGSNRLFNLAWSDGFPVYVNKLVDGKPVENKHDLPKQTLKWDFTQIAKFRFGHYTAKLLAVYDNGSEDVPIEATVSFWVLPWKLMLIGLAILAVLGYGIFGFGRSVMRKAKDVKGGMAKNLTMLKSRNFRSFLAGCLAIMCLSWPAIANAAKATPVTGGITLSPTEQNISIEPSDVDKTFNVTLTNHTTALQELDLAPHDFGSLNDTGGILLEGSNDYTQQYGLVSWLTLGTDTVILRPGESQAVPITINNRPDLQPGGHYGAVVATVNSLDNQTGNHVVINQQLLSLILVDKVGGDHYDMKLDSVSQNGNWLHLPNTVELRFQNPGNVHVVPRGLVKLKAPDGKVLAQGIINPESAFILPESYREIYVPLTTIGSSAPLPGLYHVEVDYRYDGINQDAVKNYAVRFIDLEGYLFLIIAVVVVWKGLKLWKSRQPEAPQDTEKPAVKKSTEKPKKTD